MPLQYPEQLSVQLYSLRDVIKNANQLTAALLRLAEIGYRGVEVIQLERVPFNEMLHALESVGICVSAYHPIPERILEDLDRCIEETKQLDTRYLVYSYPEGISLRTPDEVGSFIARLAAVGDTVAERGLQLVYHHHQIEFRRVEGQRILDRLIAETTPEQLQFEIDTYWVQYGGAYPVDWCRRLPNRLPLVHLKDYGINSKNEIRSLPIGEGNLNFPAIIAAAEKSACRWFVVEQDKSKAGTFDDLARSYAFLRDFFV